MFKRIATGLAYIGVLVGFFFLRNVDHRLFGIRIYAFSLIGTYEMVHAFCAPVEEKAEPLAHALRLCNSQKAAVYVYALIFTPAFYLVEEFAPGQGYRAMLVWSFSFAVALLCLLVVDHRNTTLAGTGSAMLCGLYPTAILSTMLLTNEFENASTLALLLIFVISPVADTFAFAVGSVLRGKKLCPNISPNKTISGAVGGVVFGTGASLLLYWLYTLTSDYVYTGIGSSWEGSDHRPYHLASHRVRRFGRKRGQATAGHQRHGQAAPRPRRHFRPHRRHAVCQPVRVYRLRAVRGARRALILIRKNRCKAPALQFFLSE